MPSTGVGIVIERLIPAVSSEMMPLTVASKGGSYSVVSVEESAPGNSGFGHSGGARGGNPRGRSGG